MTKLLVTGGAGFIGANFIYYELAHHPADQILCLDSLTYAGNITTLKEAMKAPGMRFVRADITDRETVFRLFDSYRPDVVVNFAAESHVDRSIRDPGVFLQTNIMGTQILMDACLQYGAQRFHQVSTDEVYGDLPLDRPDLLFVESTPLRASSPYSASKAAADLLVGAYVRTFQLPATISRCSNNYGPYQFPEKLIPLMIARAMAHQPLPVYGKGENIRDWLYVEDHCAAVDSIIRRGKAGEIYNIGGHNERSNLDVVKTILRELGEPESLITFVADRPGHDLRYAIDPEKIRRELGWQPATSFQDGIRATVQWYRDHQAWWQEILSGRYAEENQRIGTIR
jgi:dTDP-glucose 4,6-dehydratase|nr:dTDP-glucose 4,6-dehydratase [uncultured Oscillibacter sp.]